ncbi:zinc ribbon domain-containing protein [Candidatus Omnitrophota bacterium]
MSNPDYDNFDFTTEQELPEEHTGSTRPCPHCKQPISSDSLFCLYCGGAVSSDAKNRWLPLVSLIVLAAFILWILIR